MSELSKQVDEITDFLEIVGSHPGRVIITPQVYITHITTLFFVIKQLKKEMNDVAIETKDFRAYDRFVLMVERLGI